LQSTPQILGGLRLEDKRAGLGWFVRRGSPTGGTVQGSVIEASISSDKKYLATGKHIVGCPCRRRRGEERGGRGVEESRGPPQA